VNLKKKLKVILILLFILYIDLIKKIIKAKVWKNAGKEDWECIKMGLCVYFREEHTTEIYKMYKDISSDVRKEMMESNNDFKQCYRKYSSKND
jgi:hypothetical protein